MSCGDCHHFVKIDDRPMTIMGYCDWLKSPEAGNTKIPASVLRLVEIGILMDEGDGHGCRGFKNRTTPTKERPT